mmetsp:Transcript_28706/g.68493  ORF Transcript_28706/g.68493 Transcript_28706/m.68493 type:complete len:313 (+) Transcript_28706:3325-4263(+)
MGAASRAVEALAVGVRKGVAEERARGALHAHPPPRAPDCRKRRAPRAQQRGGRPSACVCLGPGVLHLRRPHPDRAQRLPAPGHRARAQPHQQQRPGRDQVPGEPRQGGPGARPSARPEPRDPGAALLPAGLGGGVPGGGPLILPHLLALGPEDAAARPGGHQDLPGGHGWEEGGQEAVLHGPPRLGRHSRHRGQPRAVAEHDRAEHGARHGRDRRRRLLRRARVCPLDSREQPAADGGAPLPDAPRGDQEGGCLGSADAPVEEAVEAAAGQAAGRRGRGAGVVRGGGPRRAVPDGAPAAERDLHLWRHGRRR